MINTGLGTTSGMWEMLSDILAEQGEKLPVSLNKAIYKLIDGEAFISDTTLLKEGENYDNKS